ncbi:hypothetical protein [Streptomyces misionensis]|uniref:hypothetical protein n=1 Tax=Streptomyces misionensis TaxID=67331 RepID=UPI0036ABE725
MFDYLSLPRCYGRVSWDDSALAEQIVPDRRVTTWDYAPGTHRPVTQTDHLPHDTSGTTSFLTRLAEESDCELAPRLYAVVRNRPVQRHPAQRPLPQ